jgi:hypothetical protein
MKPKVIFFSRSYQAILFPYLKSEKYDSIHVTLTEQEKKNLEIKGLVIDFCYETYNNIVEKIPSDYLITSYLSDRFLNKNKVTKRISILKKEISFWSEIFDTYKPIAIINEQVAIEIAEVMYIEAKKRKIQYKAWMTNPVNGYFYWITDPINLSLDQHIFIATPSSIAKRIAEEYIQKLIQENERPYYLSPFLNQRKLNNLISSFKGLSKTILKELFCKNNGYENSKAADYNAFERAIKSIFLKYNVYSDFDKYEMVVYPLHYEPESSLSYLSEFFSNQIALIENISKCLLINQVLVVKEHPAQPGMLLTKKYQELYRNNSSVYFLPSTVVSFELIKKASLIITLTSHLGWEALVLGKPVFLLGKMFYDKYQYINNFYSFEKLRDEIRTRSYKHPTQESIITFVAQLLEISYKGMPFPCDDLYSEKNIKDIILAIEKELCLL